MSMNFTHFYRKPPKQLVEHFEEDFSLANVGFIRQYPYSSWNNLVLNDELAEDAVLEDVNLYKKYGGGTIVENSTEGLERKLDFYKSVSEKTGVHIVAGTGYYIADLQPADNLHRTSEELYCQMLKELTEGCVDNPQIKAGFIGEVASVWPIRAGYVDSWFLMDKPYLPLFIMISYLLFVLRVGPAYMEHRSPINLRYVLLFYNVLQMLMSVFLVKLGMEAILRHGIFPNTCVFEQEDVKREFLPGCYWYVIAKMTELLDTVFFVLRKKQNQVTFLHVYHHTIVLVLSWLVVKYGNAEFLIFFGTLNAFVHIWMYGYYALSVFPEISKYLWWKKYLTTLQLVQFVLALVQFAVNNAISKCSPSKLVIAATLFNGFLFLYLFSNFYRNTYGEEKEEKQKKKKESNEKESFLNGIDPATAAFIRKNQMRYKKR